MKQLELKFYPKITADPVSELKFIMKELNWGVMQIAKALGCSRNSVHNWLSSKYPMSSTDAVAVALILVIKRGKLANYPDSNVIQEAKNRINDADIMGNRPRGRPKKTSQEELLTI